jgi:hypothetical protein
VPNLTGHDNPGRPGGVGGTAPGRKPALDRD